jgi:hypothetical protein
MDILQTNKSRPSLPGWLSITFWNKRLLQLYILSLPFVSAFAYSGTITISVLLAVCLFSLMTISILEFLKTPPGFIGYDLILFSLFTIITIFSFMVNGMGNSTSFNHTVAYTTTFLVFYGAVKFALFKPADKDWVFIQVLKGIAFVTFISALFANAEFISNNFFDHDLTQYIPRPGEDNDHYRPTAIGLFYRARSFSPEPGHFAYMLEMFTPVTIYYMYFSGLCKWKAFFKGSVVILIVSSFIFAVSTASFVIIPAAMLLATIIHFKKITTFLKRQSTRFYISSAIITGITLFINYTFSISSLLLLSITDKKENGLDYRQENINFFFQKFFSFDFTQQIVGAGPAGVNILGYDEQSAILNLYYSVCFETGYLGLLLMLSLFGYFLWKAVAIKNKIGFFLVLSLLSGMMHFYFISNFWYPWFWFIAAFTIFCYRKFHAAHVT